MDGPEHEVPGLQNRLQASQSKPRRMKTKTMKNIFKFLSGALFVALVAIGACNSNTTPGQIQIGMLAPLTGNGASFGISQRDGVQLALDEINAKGGINGLKLELIVEDTKTEPPTAVTATNKLISQNKVPVIIGSAASLDVPAYMDLLEKAHVPQILPVAVLPKITEGDAKWTFRSAMNDKIAATKMAEFVVNELQAKKVAILLEDSAFGSTGMVFGERLEQLGVKPLTVEKFKRGDLDMSAQLIKIKNLGATHIQFWGYYADYAQIARQMKDLGVHAQLMGNQAPVTEKTIELGGQAVEGVIDICLFVPTSEDPKIKSFTDNFRAKYNRLPDTWAAQSYDGMYILAEALRQGGTDPQKIRDALAATKDFNGVTGTITFNSKGDAEFRGTSVVVVRQGRFVPYKN
jgi:branched-chain amino acid transport system substrate-binding protein